MVIDVGGGKGYCDAGFEKWYVDSNLVVAFCCRVCRNRDFQQPSGRIVDAFEAILAIRWPNDVFRG